MSGIREIYVHLKVRISMFKANKKKQEWFYAYICCNFTLVSKQNNKQSWIFYFFLVLTYCTVQSIFCIGQKRERDGKRVSNKQVNVHAPSEPTLITKIPLPHSFPVYVISNFFLWDETHVLLEELDDLQDGLLDGPVHRLEGQLGAVGLLVGLHGIDIGNCVVFFCRIRKTILIFHVFIQVLHMK